jgi:hypothetical protein
MSLPARTQSNAESTAASSSLSSTDSVPEPPIVYGAIAMGHAWSVCRSALHPAASTDSLRASSWQPASQRNPRFLESFPLRLDMYASGRCQCVEGSWDYDFAACRPLSRKCHDSSQARSKPSRFVPGRTSFALDLREPGGGRRATLVPLTPQRSTSRSQRTLVRICI